MPVGADDLRYLLDTSILIYLANRRSPAVDARFARLRPGQVAMSCITFGELLYGAEKSARREAVLRTLQRLAEKIRVLPLERSVSTEYGRLRAALERKGTPLGNNDLWIAAHALAAQLTLVTNDQREFGRVPGLRTENWA
jgi:tRNA(fMet)-specific endonuclease VapC